MTAKRYVRCDQGHVLDASLLEACPRCAQLRPLAPKTPPLAEEVVVSQPTVKQVTKSRIGPAAIAGGVGMLALASLGAHDAYSSCTDRWILRTACEVASTEPHGAPATAKPEPPTSQDDHAGSVPKDVSTDTPRPNDTSHPVESKPTEEAGRKVQDNAPKAGPGAVADADESQRLALQQEAAKKAPEDLSRQQQADRLERFLRLSPAVVAAARNALAPVAPGDADPALDALSQNPFAETQLHLSKALRHTLAGTRSLSAYRRGDIATARRYLTVLAADETIDSGRPDFLSQFGLGYIEARKSTDPNDYQDGARRILRAGQLGSSDAIAELANDAKLADAAGARAPDLSAMLETAAVQDPSKFDMLFTKRGLDMTLAKQRRANFFAATAAKNWTAISDVYLAIGDRKAPAIDSALALALLQAPSFKGPYDRLPVGALTSALGLIPEGQQMVAFICERGLAGVTPDGPNAAVWLILSLAGKAPDDKAFTSARESYKRVRQGLNEGQRELVNQLATEFGVP